MDLNNIKYMYKKKLVRNNTHETQKMKDNKYIIKKTGSVNKCLQIKDLMPQCQLTHPISQLLSYFPSRFPK